MNNNIYNNNGIERIRIGVVKVERNNKTKKKLYIKRAKKRINNEYSYKNI